MESALLHCHDATALIHEWKTHLAVTPLPIAPLEEDGGGGGIGAFFGWGKKKKKKLAGKSYHDVLRGGAWVRKGGGGGNLWAQRVCGELG